jgi:hypothetical protein
MIRLTIRKSFRNSIAPLLCAIFLFALPNARAQDQNRHDEDPNWHTYGFDVAMQDANDKTATDDGNPGVTAPNFYKLLDNSIGDNFSGLILVFGGCYTGDFSTLVSEKIKTKPVAILAATAKENSAQCTPSIDGENPFLTGVIDNLGGSDLTAENSKNGTITASAAFDAGMGKMTHAVNQYNEDHILAINERTIKKAEKSNPSFTAFPKPEDPNSPSLGAKLTLRGPDGGRGEKYAIIFMGKPETIYDWNALQTQYQSLIDAGYESGHIEAFFGTGAKGTGNDLDIPLLTNHDSGKPGISVAQDQRKRGENQNGQLPAVTYTFMANGQTTPKQVPFKAATFGNLKRALSDWKKHAVKDTAGDNQYFILIGTHSTNMAHPRPKDLEITQLLLPSPAGGPYYAGGPSPAPAPGETGTTPVSLTGPISTTAEFTGSVVTSPPELPVYEQPRCPGEGYIWTPGYWAWGDDDYYWVPGTWVLAPEVGFLWTPGYWGWGGGSFMFYQGYWGPRIGFYGGINYGYGYFGHGYEGGRWDHDHFYYNRAVNNVDVTVVHNVYEARIENNYTTTTRVSYNGGNGGINERPRPEEDAAARERHIPPVSAQVQHVQAARTNPQLRASTNQGKPPIAATPTPGAFKESGVVPAKEGGRYNPSARTESNAAARTGTGDAALTPAIHPKDIPPAERPAPANTGNPEVDKKYQQQQDKLITRQEQDRQRLQQKQEQDHQQLAQKNAVDARKQQIEQQHQQQTQQLAQKHVQQQKKLQEKQQPPPRQNDAKPPSRKP